MDLETEFNWTLYKNGDCPNPYAYQSNSLQNSLWLYLFIPFTNLESTAKWTSTQTYPCFLNKIRYTLIFTIAFTHQTLLNIFKHAQDPGWCWMTWKPPKNASKNRPAGRCSRSPWPLLPAALLAPSTMHPARWRCPRPSAGKPQEFSWDSGENQVLEMMVPDVLGVPC